MEYAREDTHLTGEKFEKRSEEEEKRGTTKLCRGAAAAKEEREREREREKRERRDRSDGFEAAKK